MTNRRKGLTGGWERALLRLVLQLGRTPWGDSGYGHARGVLRVFRWAEWLVELMHPLQRVEGGSILRYEVTSLPARDIPIQPVPIRHGDPVIVVHFDGGAVGKLAAAAGSRSGAAWGIYRAAAHDFPALARMVERGVFPGGVRAVWMEAVFYPVMARFGFSIRPAASTFRTPFARLFIFGLMVIYGPGGTGKHQVEQFEHWQLGEAWMTLEEFLQRFGDAAEQTPIELPNTLQTPYKHPTRSRADGCSEEEHGEPETFANWGE